MRGRRRVEFPLDLVMLGSLLHYFLLVQFIYLFTHLFFSPDKFVPLSDITYEGVPLLAVIRINAFMNKSVSNEYAISKCTARVAKHVNKQRYRFIQDFPRPCFVKNGPAKSVPILSKALNDKVNLDAGRGAIF